MSYRAMFELAGRTALVTGACGTLGPAFCQGLAEFGANVVVTDLDRRKAEALAAELETRHGVETLGLACDVSSPAAVDAMATAALARFGAIDILHNNAGNPPSDPAVYFARFEDYELAEWRRVLATDLDGMFLVAKTVGGHMAARGQGVIVQTASIYGALGADQRIYEGAASEGHAINNPAVYGTGKAGVIGLTRWLAAYWAPRGVRVNALVPGGVEGGQNERFIARYANRVPLDRMARREEMVGALIWLVSDASSYVTGQAIFVDGGLSAW
jgi:NAD(P)-dependent dehydrogenase (short-subunit alcohol dehydrogenase family)